MNAFPLQRGSNGSGNRDHGRRLHSPALEGTMSAAASLVTHPERDSAGTIVDQPDTPAWTPDELTGVPPAAGMVKVRWSDSADPAALFWEYSHELCPAHANDTMKRS
ncbi:hypothetical protein [Mycobacterium sp. 1245111.1]|uniref:hypothetical protein n=1 Tax=Mycobacterium sp. 1245111.1 TaxID=1834073 RepID=UPI0012EA50D7|nr:hypothetical protein [Mycobacterium sp. 1245111.1]